MTTKNKAEELVDKYTNIEVLGYKEDLDRLVAIECAKIAVDEIINERENLLLFYPKMTTNKLYFWQEVKNELNNML